MSSSCRSASTEQYPEARDTDLVEKNKESREDGRNGKISMPIFWREASLIGGGPLFAIAFAPQCGVFCGVDSAYRWSAHNVLLPNHNIR